MTDQAASSEAHTDRAPISRLFRELSLEFFLEHIPSGSRVLDCGCGDGAVSLPLAAKGCEVDALDIKPERLARLDAARGALPIRTHCADIMSARFEEETFDYVISRQFLTHFPDRWRQVLLWQLRLCKFGGAVILHLHSADNFAMAERIAPRARRAAVRRGYPHNGQASVADLERLCRRHACTLEKLVPVSFFAPRMVLYRTGLGKREREQYEGELQRRMQAPEVYEFVKWYESAITAKLPSALSGSYLAVIRRSAPKSGLSGIMRRLGSALRRPSGKRQK
jgi:SAM-dependent methyltransferase